MWFLKEKYWYDIHKNITLNKYVPLLNIWDKYKWKEKLKINKINSNDYC